MNIFGNTAESFNKDVDSAMFAFKSTIEKLRSTAEKAEETKAVKKDKIKELETECGALDEVSAKANNLAAKLEALFK